MDVFKLLGRIAVDNSDAMSGMDDTVRKAKDTESNLTKIFKKVGTVVATAFATDKIIEFGNACKDAYVEIAAEQAAFAQIMGEYADVAQGKLEGVADSTGSVSTRMTQYMTSLTAKFKGLGYGVEDATDMAAMGLTMAADAAAFWDKSLDESMSHLNSFVNGSYEGGEAIGLFANDTQMAMYAVQKGLVATTKEWSALDEATKQATRLEYAQNMMETSGVIGQAAKEAGSYANVQANLTESWRQFKAVIGEPIVEKMVIPAMQKLNDLMPKLTDSVSKGIDWLLDGFDKIGSYFSNVFTDGGINWNALPDAFSAMFTDLSASVSGLLANVGAAIKNSWENEVWPTIQGLFKAVFGVDLPSWDDLKTNISDGWNNTVWPSIQNFFSQTFGIDLPEWGDIVDKISKWWSNVETAIAGFFKAFFGIQTRDTDESGKSYVSIMKNWFTGKLESIGDFWNAFFGIKTKDTDTDGRTFADKLKDWFAGVLTSIGDIWFAIFGLKTSDTDTDGTTFVDKLKNWFAGVLTSIGDIWFAFFGLNTRDADNDGLSYVEKLKNWFTGVLTSIGDFWFAFFGLKTRDVDDGGETFVDKLKNWFAGILTSIGDFWFAFFGLKTRDADDNGETFVDKLKNWFTGVLTSIGDFWFAFFGLKTRDVDDSGETFVDKLRNWFAGVLTSIGDYWFAFFGLKTRDTDDNGETFVDKLKNWFTGVLAAIGDFWCAFFGLKTRDKNSEGVSYTDVLKNWFNGILAAAGNVFNVVASVVGGAISAARDTINKWWGDVKSGLDLSATATVQTVYNEVQKQSAYKDGNGGTAAGSTSAGTTGGTVGGVINAFTTWFGDLTGNYVGLDYVPYDNYVSRLHKGEAVLTRTEAEAWRSGYGNTGRMEAILSNVENLLQAVVQNTGASKQIVLDSGALVGQLAPGMDAQLGTISNRKGRRN